MPIQNDQQDSCIKVVFRLFVVERDRRRISREPSKMREIRLTRGKPKELIEVSLKYPVKRTFLKDLVSRVYRPEARLPGQTFTDGDRRSSSLA